jgi:hypothetical protein
MHASNCKIEKKEHRINMVKDICHFAHKDKYLVLLGLEILACRL